MMIAAWRLAIQSARCPSCPVPLLNSLFGTQLRLPATAATPRTVARYRSPVLPRRLFHGSAIRFNTTERPDGIVVEEDFSASSTKAVTVSTAETTTDEGFSLSTKEVAAEPTVQTTEEEFSLSSEEGVTESTVGITEEEFSEESIPEPTLEKKADPVPWFLRVETPLLTSHPLAGRQALPEIPSDAPPALEPLLKHLSRELGINELTLLDLRTMDPPPAIGANTIMIIGNARSERHLHVSADKTCRWLRSEWKMTPHADGLLGRNEIKIKNRRLKKRGRLVNAETGAVEGVGWICVDVGSQGLVVQLFTKDRRGEINLEKLWGNFLKKEGASIAKAVSIQHMFGEKKPVEDVKVKYIPPTPAVRLGVGLSPGSGFTRTQTRSFHTTPHQHAVGEPKPRIQEPQLVSNFVFKGIDVAKCAERGQYWQIFKQLPKPYNPTRRIANLILGAQINHLKISYPGPNGSGSRTGPCNLLGDGPADTTSTEFITILHRNLACLKPTEHTFRYRLEFLAEAHRLQPSAYPVSCFPALLGTALALNLPPEFYYLALRAISDSPRLRPFLPWEKSSAVLIETMNEVTEHMKSHCTRPDISTPEIQYCFFRALAPHLLDQVHTVAATICSQTLALSNRPIDYVWQRYPPMRVGTYTLDARLNTIDSALAGSSHPYTLREYQEALLTTYAMGGAWIAFWNRWKSMRYMCVHRDAELFGLMIGLLVMGANQNECVNAVRWLPVDMAREVPGVGLTAGMARGMLRLVEIAEGERREDGGGGEFEALRVRCEGVVERVKRREEKLKSSEAQG